MSSTSGKRHLILIAGVEGGGVSLYGEETGGSWRFSSEYVDQSATFLNEPSEHCELRRKTVVVNTWEEALALLDRQD